MFRSNNLSWHMVGWPKSYLENTRGISYIEAWRTMIHTVWSNIGSYPTHKNSPMANECTPTAVWQLYHRIFFSFLRLFIYAYVIKNEEYDSYATFVCFSSFGTWVEAGMWSIGRRSQWWEKRFRLRKSFGRREETEQCILFVSDWNRFFLSWRNWKVCRRSRWTFSARCTSVKMRRKW